VVAITISLEKEAGSDGSKRIDLEIDIIDDLVDRKDFRSPVHKAEVDDAEIDLKLGVFKKVVDDDFRDAIAADFDDYADAFLVGFIANIGDAIDDLVTDELGHFRNHRRFVHLIRDLGDDDAALAVIFFFNVVTAANRDAEPVPVV
jgi:hypothetical protein